MPKQQRRASTTATPSPGEEYPKLVPSGKLRGYWMLAPGVFQPPCGFSVEPPFVCLLPLGHEGAHYMADTSAREDSDAR